MCAGASEREMSIPTIFETCRPRGDVLAGVIADADFAADLASVVSRRAGPEYLDPVRFFADTYPTRGLKNLPRQCVPATIRSRRRGRVNLPARYGLWRRQDPRADRVGPRRPWPEGGAERRGVRRHLPASHGPCPHRRLRWRECRSGQRPGDGWRGCWPIRLGARSPTPLAGKDAYARVRTSDENRIAPGAETLRELFGGDATLILLDELSVYLRKVRRLDDARDQLTAFLTSLFKAVEGAPNAALVYTLAIGKDGRSTDAYSEENRFIAEHMAEAESVSARKATLLNPTEEDETVQVLRRRLFESIDEARIEGAVEAYRELWAATRDSLAAEAGRPETEETFRSSYPLHPEVLATLTGKTATLGNFQRVRGMLRLLARTIAHLWEEKPENATAIHPHHIDPGHEPIRQEIVTRLGQTAYLPAIANDVAGGGAETKALAQEIDAEHHGGLPPYATYVARTIFPAHPRLQRSPQGPFTRTVALLDPMPRNRHQLHRGGAQEVHRRIRLPRRSAGRPDALSRRSEPPPDHPARGTARGCGGSEGRAERPHPEDLRREDLLPGAIPRRAVRRPRRGRRRPAEAHRSVLRRGDHRELRR